MKKSFILKSIRYLIPLIVATALIVSTFGSVSAATYPTIAITSVDPGKTVTISGQNFPTGQTFTVRMGKRGTFALGGTIVGTLNTGTQTKISATFNIPADLAKDESVAIRLDSPTGFYAYNWFYNTAAPVNNSNPQTPIPTFSIVDVERDLAVGIETKNLPAGQTFTVRMGEISTRGINGIVVGTLNSAEGGVLKARFSIPAELAGKKQISIRMDSPEGFFAYNWFWNNSTSTAGGGGEGQGGYTGIPTFSIQAVERDKTVTIAGKNFPANETFKVTMGVMGKKGVGGYDAGSYASGTGGEFTQTFTIPVEMAGSTRIAIRLETASGVFYTFNWFWNNTTPVN
ncbi:MAG: hypothetical protein KBD67_08425 [Anaerolineaceae bacterium]|nr:hypothetical protein [Anaerolineaceae bacterium]